MDEEKQLGIQLQLTELVTKIEVVLEKQDELMENMGKIKEAVYNPDQGLYARLKEMDLRLREIENWKSAPVWTPAKIKIATKEWFKFLKPKR